MSLQKFCPIKIWRSHRHNSYRKPSAALFAKRQRMTITKVKYNDSCQWQPFERNVPGWAYSTQSMMRAVGRFYVAICSHNLTVCPTSDTGMDGGSTISSFSLCSSSSSITLRNSSSAIRIQSYRQRGKASFTFNCRGKEMFQKNWNCFSSICLIWKHYIS